MWFVWKFAFFFISCLLPTESHRYAPSYLNECEGMIAETIPSAEVSKYPRQWIIPSNSHGIRKSSHRHDFGPSLTWHRFNPFYQHIPMFMRPPVMIEIRIDHINIPDGFELTIDALHPTKTGSHLKWNGIINRQVLQVDAERVNVGIHPTSYRPQYPTGQSIHLRLRYSCYHAKVIGKVTGPVCHEVGKFVLYGQLKMETELTCPPTTSGEITMSQCVWPRQLCDGKRDCSNGEDEAICLNKNTTNLDSTFKMVDQWRKNQSMTQGKCSPTQFGCPRRTVRGWVWECVRDHRVCDGIKDCPLGEDETIHACHARHAEGGSKQLKNCPESMFECPVEGKCIPHEVVCNSVPDCLEGHDEKMEACIWKKSIIQVIYHDEKQDESTEGLPKQTTSSTMNEQGGSTSSDTGSPTNSITTVTIGLLIGSYTTSQTEYGAGTESLATNPLPMITMTTIQITQQPTLTSSDRASSGFDTPTLSSLASTVVLEEAITTPPMSTLENRGFPTTTNTTSAAESTTKVLDQFTMTVPPSSVSPTPAVSSQEIPSITMGVNATEGTEESMHSSSSVSTTTTDRTMAQKQTTTPQSNTATTLALNETIIMTTTEDTVETEQQSTTSPQQTMSTIELNLFATTRGFSNIQTISPDTPQLATTPSSETMSSPFPVTTSNDLESTPYSDIPTGQIGASTVTSSPSTLTTVELENASTSESNLASTNTAAISSTTNLPFIEATSKSMPTVRSSTTEQSTESVWVTVTDQSTQLGSSTTTLPDETQSSTLRAVSPTQTTMPLSTLQINTESTVSGSDTTPLITTGVYSTDRLTSDLVSSATSSLTSDGLEIPTSEPSTPSVSSTSTVTETINNPTTTDQQSTEYSERPPQLITPPISSTPVTEVPTISTYSTSILSESTMLPTSGTFVTDSSEQSTAPVQTPLITELTSTDNPSSIVTTPIPLSTMQQISESSTMNAVSSTGTMGTTSPVITSATNEVSSTTEGTPMSSVMTPTTETSLPTMNPLITELTSTENPSYIVTTPIPLSTMQQISESSTMNTVSSTGTMETTSPVITSATNEVSTTTEGTPMSSLMTPTTEASLPTIYPLITELTSTENPSSIVTTPIHLSTIQQISESSTMNTVSSTGTMETTSPVITSATNEVSTTTEGTPMSSLMTPTTETSLPTIYPLITELTSTENPSYIVTTPIPLSTMQQISESSTMNTVSSTVTMGTTSPVITSATNEVSSTTEGTPMSSLMTPTTETSLPTIYPLITELTSTENPSSTVTTPIPLSTIQQISESSTMNMVSSTVIMGTTSPVATSATNEASSTTEGTSISPVMTPTTETSRPTTYTQLTSTSSPLVSTIPTDMTTTSTNVTLTNMPPVSWSINDLIEAMRNGTTPSVPEDIAAIFNVTSANAYAASFGNGTTPPVALLHEQMSLNDTQFVLIRRNGSEKQPCLGLVFPGRGNTLWILVLQTVCGDLANFHDSVVVTSNGSNLISSSQLQESHTLQTDYWKNETLSLIKTKTMANVGNTLKSVDFVSYLDPPPTTVDQCHVINVNPSSSEAIQHTKLEEVFYEQCVHVHDDNCTIDVSCSVNRKIDGLILCTELQKNRFLVVGRVTIPSERCTSSSNGKIQVVPTLFDKGLVTQIGTILDSSKA